MNDTRRRMLTEYLGECWHEITDKGPYQSTCSKCGMTFGAIHTSDWDPAGFNRTFTTAQDMVDLVKRIERVGDLGNFTSFSYPKWGEYCAAHGYPKNKYGGHIAWLITDPARTCELIAEWMEGEHET